MLREKRGSLLACLAPGTHSSNVICTSEHPRLAWHWEIKDSIISLKRDRLRERRPVAPSQNWQEKVSECVGAGVRDT